MGQEFYDAVESEDWDVLPSETRIHLYHVHRVYSPLGEISSPMKFLVDEQTRECRICGAKASDFVWFRYKTWKLRTLTA